MSANSSSNAEGPPLRPLLPFGSGIFGGNRAELFEIEVVLEVVQNLVVDFVGTVESNQFAAARGDAGDDEVEVGRDGLLAFFDSALKIFGGRRTATVEVQQLGVNELAIGVVGETFYGGQPGFEHRNLGRKDL